MLFSPILFDWALVLFPKWILPNLPNSLNHDKILKWYGHQRYYLSGYRYNRNNSRMYIFLIACEHVSPLTTLDRCVRGGSSRIFFCYSIREYIYYLTWGISDNHLTIRLCCDSLVSTLHNVWQTIYDAKFGPVWGICLSKSYTTGYSGLPRIPSPPPTSPHTGLLVEDFKTLVQKTPPRPPKIGTAHGWNFSPE